MPCGIVCACCVCVHVCVRWRVCALACVCMWCVCCNAPLCMCRHGSKLYFSIPTQAIPLSAMFGAVEAAKDRLGIQEYSLSQTSLEQV